VCAPRRDEARGGRQAMDGLGVRARITVSIGQDKSITWRRWVSPILVRPVREQLEHDRIIRLLQTKSKRRFEASINPGTEQNAPVKSGTASLYPDLVLFSTERGHRLQAVVEVETGESVNHLEALAQWTQLARVRAAFFLYVPAGMVDVARRLCDDNQIVANEIWSYHTLGDQVRFTLVHRSREASAPPPRPARRPAEAQAARRKPAARPTKTAAKKPVKKARAKRK
jgi:hypothetical protein